MDKLIFGRELDNSEANDADEDRLYEGAGTRSKQNVNPMDVTTRTTEKMTDEKIYGNVHVVGTSIELDPQANLCLVC